MKRRTLVALLVTAAVIGGLLLLFPLEWVGLLVALLVLLTAQAVLILRHTRVVSGAPDSSLKPKFSTAMLESQHVARRQAAPPAPRAEDAPPPDGGALPTSEVFSRFRSHLETMERGAPAQAQASGPSAAPAPSEAAAAAGANVQDRVELSAGAKKPAPSAAPEPAAQPAPGATTRDAKAPQPRTETPEPEPAAATAAPSRAAPSPPAAKPRPERAAPKARPGLSEALKAVTDEGDETDLFADLRPDIAVARGGAPPRPSAATPAPPTPPRDEVGEALARASEPQSIRDEGNALIRLAEEAMAEGNLARAKAMIEQYEALVSDAPELASWQAARAELRLASREGRAEAAGPAYQAMLDRGYAPKEETLEAEIDAVLEGLPEAGKTAAKVTLMVKALAPFRQAGDRAALDRLYSRIEAVQETADDPRRLLQFYKNHLAIKEALGDVQGQLNLIDHIGNRYFQLGDTAPAKEFYERGMKLRSEVEQARDKAAPTAGGQAEAPPTEGAGGEAKTSGN